MIAVCAPPRWEAGFLPKPVLTIRQAAVRTAETAVRALLREAEAGPKPGLVDRFGPGVHTDMDISHFRLSAAALRPFFEAITLESAKSMAETRHPGHGRVDDTADAPAVLADTLRNLGLQAEAAMLAATGGVNTHKGAIWTIGLLCAAIGVTVGYRSRNAACILPASNPDIRETVTVFLPSVPDRREAGSGYLIAEAVCAQADRLAHAILSLGLDPDSRTDSPHTVKTSPHPGVQPFPGVTKGLVARQAYGLRSARDEALEGFPSIQSRALPLARKLRNSTVPEDYKVISVLLAVMCKLDDTCIAARGGLPALQMAKASARKVLNAGGPSSVAGGFLYRKMVTDFKEAGLSPGGSADLCAASLFLADMEAES